MLSVNFAMHGVSKKNYKMNINYSRNKCCIYNLIMLFVLLKIFQIIYCFSLALVITYSSQKIGLTVDDKYRFVTLTL